MTVTKGEAQARVVSVNAEAEAQRTTLEGNAEAGITFTKGEAEAKALALRADAYRQFNEAAIIQTVMAMLPEIVRAAAEPLLEHDTLTVLSNDGASDVVKTVTRTVTEANATVKGLTGIDIPALVSNAVGSTEPPTDPTGRTPGAQVGVRAARAAGQVADPGECRRRTVRRDEPSRLRRGPVYQRRYRAPDLAEAWGARPAGTTAATPASEPTSLGQAALDRHGRRSRRRDGRRRPRDPGDDRRDAGARRADGHGRRAGPPGPWHASGECRHHHRDDGRRGRHEARLGPARDPGIERFAGFRLGDLETRGPRPLRLMWQISREQLDQRYGQLTIGELIDRYGRRHPAAA